MANICLPKDKVQEFREALKKRVIKLEDLLNMTTEERTTLLEKYAGDQAKLVNTLFEEKLVLKNRIQGLKNWASKTGEIGRYDPAKKAKLDALLSEYRAKQQERIFSPKENETFLADLAAEKLGTRISKEEAQQVFDLSKKSEDLFQNYDSKTETWKSPESQVEYEASKVVYERFVNNLKNDSLPIKGMLKEYSAEIKALWKENKPKAVAQVIGDSIFNLSKTLINTVASWDNSFIGRQGGITLVKSPKIWWDMARKSLTDIYGAFKGKNPEDVLMGNIYGDPDYINGNYAKAKLSLGIEEEVPTKILERIPGVGRVFKASDVAFVDSAIRSRTGLFKMMKKIHEKTGQPLDDVALEDIGKVVNAITARGKLGQIGTSKPVQLLMWAPRMLKADWDVMTGHTFGVGLDTKFARVQAAKTVFNVVVATAGIAVIAKAMGAQVETDPRSSGFLKIKIGNTRINQPFARGMPQLVTLFSRLLTQKTKTSAGVLKELNSGDFGSQTLFDVGMDFLVNKTTPPAGTVIDWLRGRNFAGQKPTIGNTAFGFLPISVQNFIQLKDDSSTQAVIGAFVDLIGIGSNTYSSTDTDWTQNPGVELQQFQKKVGDVKFKEANDSYNKKVDDWMNSVKTNPKYQALSEEDKQKVITKKKDEIKQKLFKKYNFIYKQAQSKPIPKF